MILPTSTRLSASVGFYVAFTLGLCLSSASKAQTFKPNADRPLFHGSLTLGFGDCDQRMCGDLEADTSPLIGVGGRFLVRPIPYFAGGVELHHNWIAADDRDADRFDEVASYFLANLVVRGILPIGRLEPWGGFGFGYSWWGYAWSEKDKEEDLTVDGINFALQSGLDYWISDAFSIGGEMRLSFPSWSERCKEETKPNETKLECRDFDTLDPPDQDELPNLLWYVGVTAGLGFG